MNNLYFDVYVDEEGNKDTKPTLNSEGFAQITDDLEELVSKFLNIKDGSFILSDDDELNNIRLDLMAYLDKKVQQ
tara:strand:+ start:656 stop:880 length:225 start_codon:yes stop_codon:yes gene_type:complete